MKNFFSNIYNFIKSMSLIIVIVLIGFVFLAIRYPEKVEEWSSWSLEYEGDDDTFTTFNSVEKNSTSDKKKKENRFSKSKEDNNYLLNINEYQSIELKKIRIKTREGDAFLRPSQIVFVEYKKPNLHLISTASVEYLIHEREYSLSKFYQMLDRIGYSSHFFKLGISIFNCHYVELITQDEYNNKNVILENNKKISLPDKQVQPLIEHLEYKCN